MNIYAESLMTMSHAGAGKHVKFRGAFKVSTFWTLQNSLNMWSWNVFYTFVSNISVKSGKNYVV